MRITKRIHAVCMVKNNFSNNRAGCRKGSKEWEKNRRENLSVAAKITGISCFNPVTIRFILHRTHFTCSPFLRRCAEQKTPLEIIAGLIQIKVIQSEFFRVAHLFRVTFPQ